MKTGIRFSLFLLAAMMSSWLLAADGPALYKQHCAKCHGESGHADNWRGYLYFARNFTKPSWQAGMSDADILEEINAGPRIMPSYKDKLSEEEKQALIEVIRGFDGH